jgi:hypothetical protein
MDRPLKIEFPGAHIRNKKIFGKFSNEHVCKLVKAGRICYIKDGKNIRFKPENHDDYEKHSYPMGSGSRRDRMDPKSI